MSTFGIKFMYFKKVTKNDEIFTVDLMLCSKDCSSRFHSKHSTVKFIYSEKATKFCEIFPLLLTVSTVVKSKGKISQNFVTFSEYMNFISTMFTTKFTGTVFKYQIHGEDFINFCALLRKHEL